MHVVSGEDLVHRYADLGFTADDVDVAVNRFMNHLGIPLRANRLYQVHAVELSAFELYLSRLLVPMAPEVNDLRKYALAEQVNTVMTGWGSTVDDVIHTLGLDSLFNAECSRIAHTVEARINSEIRATAITFHEDYIMVDGVAWIYPSVVAEAIQQTAVRLSSRASVAPF